METNIIYIKQRGEESPFFFCILLVEIWYNNKSGSINIL